MNPYLPKKPELEWKFGVSFWGKGYATEIGKAIIKEAFKSTDIELIYGMVNPQNKTFRLNTRKFQSKNLDKERYPLWIMK